MLPKYLSSSHRVRSYRYLLLVALIALAAFLCLHAAPWRARAATLTVTNTNDSGAGSLRAAITAAASGDTIDFNLSGCPCTITLTTGELLINKSLTIQGPGAGLLTVSGNNTSRVFRIGLGVSAAFQGLTISGGKGLGAPVVDGGGGIYNGGGTLRLTSSTVSGNTGFFGGGVLNESGTLVLTSSSISGNTAEVGGGLRSVNNPKLGGFSQVTITNCTFSGNTAKGEGGAIVNSNLLTITNSTFTGNRANSDDAGGGTGGGLDTAGSATINNTIVAGNFRGTGSIPDDISGAIFGGRNNNLIGDAATSGGISNGVNGNKVGFAVSVVLNTTLAFNGGPTKTHALLGCSSPAVNTASDSFAVDPANGNAPLTTDQRGLGFQRKFAGATDMGAFELQTFCNTPPTAIEDTYTTNKNTPLNVVAPGVLNNDSEPDAGDTVTALLVSGPVNAASFTLNANGSFTYTPNSNFIGSDSFSYIARDNHNADSNPVTVAISVINTAPTASNDSYTMNEGNALNVDDPGVLSNDTDPDFDILTAVLVSGPSHAGAFTLRSDGSFNYQPSGDFSGNDSFTYKARDSDNADSNTATVSITINASNDPPTYVPGPNVVAVTQGSGPYSSPWATSISPGPPDESGQTLTFIVTGNSNPGLFSSSPSLASNGTLSFTPAANATGSSTITVVLMDNGGTANGGNDTSFPFDFTITVVPNNLRINDAKLAEPASGSANMIFTVTLSAPAPASGMSVNFTTMAETPSSLTHATPGQDYTNTSGTLTFAAGEQFKTIPVPVLADNTGEANETFLLVLSNAVNGTLADDTATGTILRMNQPGTVLISELRTSGPAGAGDDFVEVYNNSDAAITVTASDGSAGYGLFKKGASCADAPVLIGTIPNGTVMPARGHYLFVGSAYSLGSAAAGDQTLNADLEDDQSVAIFTTSDITSLSTENRRDAVGFAPNSGGVCDLLGEGSTLPSTGFATLEGSYQRDQCGKLAQSGVYGPCPTGGLPKDSNNNASDFFWADTAATNTPAGQHLGAPGPENNASPLLRNVTIPILLLDATKSGSVMPSRERTLVDPTFPSGTLTIRRRIRNDTGAAVTRLRFRIIDISTLPVPAGVADLRALDSANIMIPGILDSQTCLASTGSATTPCTVTVQGTVVEAPNQPNGGANNSTYTVNLGTPLANGASVNVQWRLGLNSTGSFKFLLNVEALP